MDVLNTARMTLRWFDGHDAPFIHELVNEPGWLRFIGDRGVNDLDTARGFIVNRLASVYRPGGLGFWAMIRHEDNEPVGMCGLIQREGLESVDLGFALLARFEGQGYAREAAAATLDYARRVVGLPRVLAITDLDNQRSQHLLRAIGFTSQGTTRLPGEDDPVALFAIELPVGDEPTPIDKLGLLHLRDRRLLVARSHGKDRFYVPGGKRDPGETDLQALAREVQEELSTELRIDDALAAGVFQASADGRADGRDVRVTAYFGELASAPVASAEIAELAWFSLADLPRMSLTGQRILQFLRYTDRID